MHRLLLIVAAIICFPVGGLTGPPLLTDDPGTPGNNNWEINMAFTVDRRHNEIFYETPVLDFNYGVGEHIQLKYEIPWVVLHERSDGTQKGLGNSLAGVKRRFLDEEKDGMDMSVYPQVEWSNPTSSVRRGLVERGTNVLLPIQAAKKLGPVVVVAEAGYKFKQHGKDDWIYGVIIQREIQKSLTLMGEIHGESDKSFGSNEVVFNIGGQWNFSKRLGLLASAGRSFKGAPDQPTLLSYLGLQLKF
jgi:hypothetical protein